jgi:hypothetical protein
MLNKFRESVLISVLMQVYYFSLKEENVLVENQYFYDSIRDNNRRLLHRSETSYLLSLFSYFHTARPFFIYCGFNIESFRIEDIFLTTFC